MAAHFKLHCHWQRKERTTLAAGIYRLPLCVAAQSLPVSSSLSAASPWWPASGRWRRRSPLPVFDRVRRCRFQIPECTVPWCLSQMWVRGQGKESDDVRQIVISAAAGPQKQKSSKGYVWRRGATPGTHGISSASGSSFSMLLTRLGPFRCSTNASWTKIIWKSVNPLYAHKLESQVNLMAVP